jgi:hypothetical protein
MNYNEDLVAYIILVCFILAIAISVYLVVLHFIHVHKVKKTSVCFEAIKRLNSKNPSLMSYQDEFVDNVKRTSKAGVHNYNFQLAAKKFFKARGYEIANNFGTYLYNCSVISNYSNDCKLLFNKFSASETIASKARLSLKRYLNMERRICSKEMVRYEPQEFHVFLQVEYTSPAGRSHCSRSLTIEAAQIEGLLFSICNLSLNPSKPEKCDINYPDLSLKLLPDIPCDLDQNLKAQHIKEFEKVTDKNEPVMEETTKTTVPVSNKERYEANPIQAKAREKKTEENHDVVGGGKKQNSEGNHEIMTVADNRQQNLRDDNVLDIDFPDLAIKRNDYLGEKQTDNESFLCFKKWNSVYKSDFSKFSYSSSGSSLEVVGTGYSEVFSGNLLIPSKRNGFKVESIGGKAFRLSGDIQSIIIPDSIKKIGFMAFFSSPKSTVASLVFKEPSSLETIANGAFFNLHVKSMIVLPSGLRKIDTDAFCGSSLPFVAFPLTLESIGGGAFSKCNNLREVQIPPSVTSVGVGLFSGCDSLEMAFIRCKLNNVPDRLFYGCKALHHVEFGETFSVFDAESVFSGCDNLKEFVIPESVKSVSASTFDGMNKESNVFLPSGISKFSCYKNRVTNPPRFFYRGTVNDWNEKVDVDTDDIELVRKIVYFFAGGKSDKENCRHWRQAI